MLQTFIVANTDKRIRKRIMQKGRTHMFSYWKYFYIFSMLHAF